MLKILDLFSGTGAFSYVFSKYDTNIVLSNDFEKASEEIYKLNFPNHKFICKDLNDIKIEDIPEHDILCGGFPCQPFRC